MVKSVEPDDVCRHHGLEKLRGAAYRAEYLRGGKGDVQKETQAKMVNASLAEHPRQEHEVVVVDPDDILRLQQLPHAGIKDSWRVCWVVGVGRSAATC